VLYNYKLIRFSSHSSITVPEIRTTGGTIPIVTHRATHAEFLRHNMYEVVSLNAIMTLNRNVFIEKRHSARVSYSLSTICFIAIEVLHSQRNKVTYHYTTSYNRNLYIAMYACAELFCVLTNVSNKFVFRLFPLKGGRL